MVQAAAVIDVRTDSPRPEDRFFVDTNVWRFFTYAKISTGDAAVKARFHQRTQTYSAYIGDCLKAKSALFWSPLSYSELAHVIEQVEFDIYKAQPGAAASPKDFRLGTRERQTVVAEMQTAWGQIESIGTVLPTPTDPAAFSAAVKLFEGYPLDGYDIFYVNAMRNANVSAIVTDDIDFIHIPGLRVFTANDKAIQRAQLFKKVAKTR